MALDSMKILMVLAFLTAVQGAIINDRCGPQFNSFYSVNPGDLLILQTYGYPSNYLPNLSCKWKVECKEGKFHIQCEKFAVICPDKFSLYGIPTPIIGLCNDVPALPAQTTGTSAGLTFISDQSIQARGFKCYFQCCG